jgi:hypothetical protein
MYVCQWSLETPFGKQSDALAIMKKWGEDKFAHSEFRRAKDARVLVGHVGVSPSAVLDEYLFESIADFERALDGMRDDRFRAHAAALAPFVVPATQHRKIYRVVD